MKTKTARPVPYSLLLSLLVAFSVVSGTINQVQLAEAIERSSAKRPLSASERTELNQKLDTFKKNYEALVVRSKRVKQLSPEQLKRFEGDTRQLRSSLTSTLMRYQGTGTADCVNDCQTEYDICLKSNAEWLCNLQAAKCLLKCVFGVVGRTDVLQ